MNFLSINSSDNFISICISSDNIVLAYEEDLRPSMHSEKIITMIESALYNTRFTYHNIDYLIIVHGPGNFTGIRVASAFAKSILLTTKIKVHSVTSFDILFARARRCVTNYNRIIIAIPAYNNQYYIQVCTRTEILKPMITSRDDIYTYANNTTYIIGPYIHTLYTTAAANIKFLPMINNIKAYHICKYASQEIMAGRKLNNNIAPFYIENPYSKKRP